MDAKRERKDVNRPSLPALPKHLASMTVEVARVVPKVVGGASASGSSGRDSISRERAARHYAAIVESSDDAIVSKDLDGVITTWNRGAQRIFGYTAEEAVGKPVTIIIPTDRHDEEPMILERVRRGERIEHYETVRQHKDGSLVDISITVSPIVDEKGEIVGASKIARDITQLKRARGRQDLLLREMNHRVKNLFSLAISVLRLSGRSAGSVPELIDSASDRLAALARAHALTLESGLGDLAQAAKPATLHSLIQAITAPHDVSGDSHASKFSVTGCDVEIDTSVISSLALLLNEFATNATKYGALSTTTGRIQIQCAIRGDTISVTWTEHGGPEIVTPTKKNNGFGDLLVRTTIAGLGGEISRDWQPNGLVVRLSIPLESLNH
jgi:PAS domain S-box-containing protein